jgi:hypothetical protein
MRSENWKELDGSLVWYDSYFLWDKAILMRPWKGYGLYQVGK